MNSTFRKSLIKAKISETKAKLEEAQAELLATKDKLIELPVVLKQLEQLKKAAALMKENPKSEAPRPASNADELTVFFIKQKLGLS